MINTNQINLLNGNGYGLKLNLRFDTSADNVGVETIINDYNTFSMDLFIDASTRMQEAADMFMETKLEIIDIKTQLNTLQQYYFSQGSLNALSQRISVLETSLNNANMAYSSATTLLDLVNQNADNIQQILSGNLSLNLTYNTDILKQGDGIVIDRSIPNQVKIYNKVQKYSNFMLCKNSSNFIQTTFSNGQSFTSTTDNNILVLDTFGNYFRQSNTNANPIDGIEYFGDTVYINISDKNVRWKVGQTLRFVFNDSINASSHSIVFRTDSENVLGSGEYGKVIGIVTAASLYTRADGSSSPIFEVICTDENQYLFNIDILR